MSHEHPHRVLLAVDGSANANCAAEYLAHYAAIFGVREVLVLFVHAETSAAVHVSDSHAVPVDITDTAKQSSEAACRILAAAKLPYALDMEVGDPADVIMRDAEAEQADEIVMGIRGTSRWTGLALGSVAYKVLHRAAIPVTIVPHPEEDRPAGLSAGDVHRVLLAVDGSKHAARAVEYVCKLHDARNQLKVELLNAPLELPAPQGYARSAVDQEMLDKCNQEAGHATLRPASNALRAAGISFDTHIVPGNPAASIVQIAQTHRCTRIVMGTRGLGPLTGLILGSVAYTVVHLARIPVTLVK